MADLFATGVSLNNGDSLPYRLDPRLKLLLLLLLIITVFSSRGFGALLCVGFLAVGLSLWRPETFRPFLQRLFYLRWLLFFTLLLHLFLTPGRTLFGLRMLSYDGLLRGLVVDLQLLLALYLTLCFALFTAPHAVAWGTAKLLRPLGYLGLPIPESGGLLILVLHFLPQVFQQGEPLAQQVKHQEAQGMTERLQHLTHLVGDALLALVEQADALAVQICRGESPLARDESVYCWQRIDSIFLLCGLLFIGSCWSL